MSLASPVVCHGNSGCGKIAIGYASARFYLNPPGDPSACSSIRTSIRSRSISARSPCAGTASCTWWASAWRSGWGGSASQHSKAGRVTVRDPRRSAVLRRARRGARRPARLRAVLQAAATTLRHPLEILAVWHGGHVLSRRISRRAARRLVGGAQARAALARGHRFPRAAHPARPSPRDGSEISSTASCPGRVTDRALGHGRSTGRRGRCRAIPRSSTSSPWKGCCCSSILWIYSARPRPTGRCRRRFSIGYGVLPLRGRVLPRARRFSGPSCPEPVDGPVAVAADDRRRRGDARLGLASAAEGLKWLHLARSTGVAMVTTGDEQMQDQTQSACRAPARAPRPGRRDPPARRRPDARPARPDAHEAAQAAAQGPDRLDRTAASIPTSGPKVPSSNRGP